ncbi:hypothetical protein FB45DRAFT_737609, partial [Roridomyces roridus]
AFEAFSPKAFSVVTELTDRLFVAHPRLKRFMPGPWTNATFNLGTQTATCPDSTEASACGWWWQALIALGDYDSEKGGHVNLWDLASVLQCPAGSVVLIPPMMRYSIVTVQPGEQRYSITLFTPASPDWASEDWPAATYLFSTLSELART